MTLKKKKKEEEEEKSKPKTYTRVWPQIVSLLSIYWLLSVLQNLKKKKKKKKKEEEKSGPKTFEDRAYY